MNESPRQTIVFKGGGMIEDENLPVQNGGQLFEQLDNFTKKGLLKVTAEITSDTGLPTALVTSITKFNDGTGNNIEEYAISLKKIFRKRSGTWSLIHTNAKTCAAGSMQFLCPYSKESTGNYKTLYYTSDGFLGQYYYNAGENFDDDYATLSNVDTVAHPMEERAGYLFIGDGNYIARLEPNGASFDADALVLPPEWRVMSLADYNDRLSIGTWQGVNIYDVAKAKLFLWDGITGNEEEVFFELGECGITALHPYQGYLIVFAGVKGNIYRFNGATLTLFKTIPDVTRRVYVKPGAVAEVNGELLFGLSDDDGDANETAKQGVWAISRKKPEDPFALSLKHLIYGGTTLKNQIGAIMANVAASGILIGVYDGTNHRIDKSSENNAALASSGTFKSQKYVWSVGKDSGESLKAVELIGKTIPTSCSVAIRYKMDDASSWSDGVTFNPGDKKLKKSIGSKEGKICQIEAKLNTSDANGAELWGINIY